MPPPNLPRGAKPTPPHKLMAALSHFVMGDTPSEFAVFPRKLSYWGNQHDGDCVSAEEAWAKALWSVMCGLAELFIPEATLVAWASQHGYLNGADLSEVMDTMASTGITVDGVTYIDGPHRKIDYSDEDLLRNAISLGPVKIAIDADALPSTAGNGSGWHALGTGHQWRQTDHCVGVGGYGPAAFLWAQLYAAGLVTSATLPSGLDPAKMMYALFTWSSIGLVDHPWIMSTTTEAWLRGPTTPGQSPVPAPVPGPLDWFSI